MLPLLLLFLAANPRWEFLVTNLQVFPGTERFFEPDARLFWRLRPNLRGLRAAERLPEREFPFTVSTDDQGRRLTPPAAGAQASILFLGDSCTFGIPVNDEEAFPAVVERRLSGVRCLNAGVPGYSAFQGRLLLEQMAASQPAPRAVVVTFWPNDGSVWDHLSDLEHAQMLEGAFTPRLTRLVRRATAPKRPRLTNEEFAAEIRALIRRTRAWGAEPIIVLWPSRPQMSGAPEIDRQQTLRRLAREHRTRLADLAQVFRSRGGAALFTDNIHATRDGYALAAEALLPLLGP